MLLNRLQTFFTHHHKKREGPLLDFVDDSAISWPSNILGLKIRRTVTAMNSEELASVNLF